MVIMKKSNLRDRLDDCTLDLSMMDWEEVPVKDIALIKKGTNLDLSMNKISNLGTSFAVLTHLTRLDLSKNLLETLPDNFGDLVLLKHLDLYSNRLTHLPLSIGKLKALRWLDLKDNQLVPVLAEKAGQCLDPKQCQACAKTVVTFLGDMQQQVDETKVELEKKKEEALKKEEEQRLKEESITSKKKKKAAKAKAEKKKENGMRSLPPTAAEKSPSPVAGVKPVVKPAKKAGKQASGVGWCGGFFTLLAWLLFTVMLVVNALLVLRAVDKDKFVALQNLASDKWSSFVVLLPPQVRETGWRVTEAVQPAVQQATEHLTRVGQLLTDKIQAWYMWVSTHDCCRQYVAGLRNMWVDLYARVRQMYSTWS